MVAANSAAPKLNFNEANTRRVPICAHHPAGPSSHAVHSSAANGNSTQLLNISSV
jgi:hypothetical protein